MSNVGKCETCGALFFGAYERETHVCPAGQARAPSAKPYTLMRAAREFMLFKRMIKLQQEIIETAEELHQIQDPPLQANITSFVAGVRESQKYFISFVKQAENLLEKLSAGMGDLRR